MAFGSPQLVALLFFFFSGVAAATTFTFQNNCKNTVWPGVQSNSGKPMIGNGGLRLRPGQAVNITSPAGWSGRFWPRRGCTFDATGRGTCTTGDCGGVLHCTGAGGAPPVSLAEFTLDSPVDYYDVSLVDGYNMPVAVVPRGGTGGCESVRCVSDVNRSCPRALRVQDESGRVVACKSACLAFGTPEYCCTGAYSNPQVCKPTSYSRVFKRACPRAYSYAYDDATSIFTCQNADYLITFC